MKAKGLFFFTSSIFSDKQKIRLWLWMVGDMMKFLPKEDLDNQMTLALRTHMPLKETVRQFFTPFYVFFLIVWTYLFNLYENFWVFAAWSFMITIGFILYDRVLNAQSQTFIVINFVKKHLDKMSEESTNHEVSPM